VDEDVLIPSSMTDLKARVIEGTNTVSASVDVPGECNLRIILRQLADSKPLGTSRSAPPKRHHSCKHLATQGRPKRQAVPVLVNYDRAVWSGLSWAVGEVKQRDLTPEEPIVVQGASLEKGTVKLKLELKGAGPHGPTGQADGGNEQSARIDRLNSCWRG
jgi:hypothetical protein